MIIPIDDTTRIRSTTMSWQYERLEKRRGGNEWRPQKYYGSLASALEGALEQELREDPAHGIVECLNAAKRITAKYAALFEFQQVRTDG